MIGRIPDINPFSGFNDKKRTSIAQPDKNNFFQERKDLLPAVCIGQQKVYADKISENKYFRKFLSSNGRLTRQEYDDIVQNHKSILIKAKRYCELSCDTQISPEDIADIAVKIHQYLGENYGDCRIISIGTSPAVLTEQLELSGMDVIFLPVSNLRSWDMSETDSRAMTNLRIVLDYLRKKGLKHDDKTNIVIDYTSSGKTLDNIYNFIAQEFRDIPLEKLKKLSLDKLFADCYKSQSPREKRKIKSLIFDISCSSIEECTNVPHFNIVPDKYSTKYERMSTVLPFGKTKDEIYEEFDNFSRPLGRAFALCTFHEIQKMNQDIYS